jgi:hypothetical protein
MLILTSPPYGPSLHGQVKASHGGPVEKWDDRYSHNPTNLAHLPLAPRRGRPTFTAALTEILGGCRRLLDPQGRLVITARPYRHQGALVDLPGQIVALAHSAGLTLTYRHVALLCRLRDSDLVPRPSFFQLQRQRAGTTPRMLLIAHEDVLVFALAGDGGTPARRER